MNDWPERLAVGLGEPALSEEEIEAVLDLARDVAHETERRFAPLTTFLAGMAAARLDGDRLTGLEMIADRIRTLLDADQQELGADELEID